MPDQLKSECSHAVLEGGSRQKKAQKIAAVLEPFVVLEACDLLDVGTGSGHVARELARTAGSVVSVDLQDERVVTDGYRFMRVTDERLPFNDESFDVVVTNHVIEHLPNQVGHLAEVHRVLRPGGCAYLATPNRWFPLEPHHRLPFLSWLPRPLADAYARSVRGQAWDIFPLSHRRLWQLVTPSFEAFDRTAEVLRRPSAHALEVPRLFGQATARIPRPWMERLGRMAPTFLFVLRKPEGSSVDPNEHP